MAFLIPDNLRSRKDVPAGIRRVASAFQVGLDDTAVVWFEPLFDPSEKKPHFVVLLPDRGIVVLEVFDTKSGGVLGTVRGKIRLVRDGNEVEVRNPLERAEQLAEVLRQRVAGEKRLADADVPIAAGAVLSSLSSEEAQDKGFGKIIAADKCLFRPHLDKAIEGEGEADLQRAFAKVLGKSANEPISEDREKLLRGLIQPEIVIDKVSQREGGREQLTIFRPPTDGGGVIRVMDKKQEAMAKSLGEGHRVIRGVAGSGKTLILVCRARLLAQLFSRKQFLVTCYTRSLAGQLRVLLQDLENVDVINLDRLMSGTIRAARLKHPGYNDDDSGERVAEVALQALKKGAGARYSAVLLDEAQDFGTNALKFALGLLESGSDDLIIVADSAQNIFRRKFSWKQAGIQAQGRTRILRLNYRNTKEILEFASNFLLSSAELTAEDVPDPEDEHALIPPEAAARSGENPRLTVCSSSQEEINQVIQTVTGWHDGGKAPGRIAVLYATSGNGGIDHARKIYKGLQNEGIKAFWLTNPSDRDARDQLAAAKEPVVLSTIHSAKGLEFPNVVLYSLWRQKDGPEENRKLAYVGMTRATDHLTVIASKDNPLLSDLKAAKG